MILSHLNHDMFMIIIWKKKCVKVTRYFCLTFDIHSSRWY